MTADHDARKQLIREVHTSTVPAGGTEVCSAIDLAYEKLLPDSSTRRSVRAIVLFSDGENIGSCERSQLSRLRAQGISLITVGLGTEAGSSIRAGRDFVRDNDHQIVRTRLTRQFLQDLARDGRGQYVEADPNGRYVNELAGVLRSLKGGITEQHRLAVSTNKYYYFLMAALGLLVLDLIVTIRTFRL